jgi:hypothetical protein
MTSVSYMNVFLESEVGVVCEMALFCTVLGLDKITIRSLLKIISPQKHFDDIN